MGNDHARLIRALQDPALYAHRVETFTVVETHIYWVILTGEYAYKIKKPVDLGFLDFSTLEKRRHYCEEELRLNRRLAPQLYLGLVRITGESEHPAIDGSGPVIEYAVKMRQFDPAQQFDRLLARKRLPARRFDEIAGRLAAFHEAAAVAPPDSPFGSPAAVWQPVAENHAQILALLREQDARRRLETLQDWFSARRQALDGLFRERKTKGAIREGHGDLHLANITLFEGKTVIFDCLEFNERLRWIDIINDAAFLVMDLENRQQRVLAWRFLNGYLEHTGDYEAMALLPFYLAYRAMVRAKVALIRRGQSGLNEDERNAAYRCFLSYLAQAEGYAARPRPALIITHGLSGAGKTTISSPLAGRLGAVRLRSDVERKRLFGLKVTQRASAPPGADLYAPDASERTYERLAGLAEGVIRAGFPVIVDATFLERRRREHFRALAMRLDVPFLILHCHAPEPLLREWIRQRLAGADDASDADLAVLDHQLARQEPLTAAERQWTLDIATERPVEEEVLHDTVTKRLWRQ